MWRQVCYVLSCRAALVLSRLPPAISPIIRAHQLDTHNFFPSIYDHNRGARNAGKPLRLFSLVHHGMSVWILVWAV